jgi:hypothetical protein
MNFREKSPNMPSGSPGFSRLDTCRAAAYWHYGVRQCATHSDQRSLPVRLRLSVSLIRLKPGLLIIENLD